MNNQKVIRETQADMHTDNPLTREERITVVQNRKC